VRFALRLTNKELIMQVRYVKRGGDLVLQQLVQVEEKDEDGNVVARPLVWQDVPTVEEE